MTGQNIQVEGELKPFYLKMIFFWVLTCAFVSLEPALFDIIFLPLAFLIVVNNRIFVSRQLGFLFPCLLLFLAAQLMSILVADDLGRAVSFSAITVYMFLMASFIGLIVSNFGYPVVDKIMQAYLVAALISAVIGVAAILHLLPGSVLDSVSSYNVTRARAFFKDPNVYAPFLMGALIYTVHLFFTQKARRIFWGGAIFILMFGILVGFSRAAWGVSLCALVFYFVLSALADRRFKQLLSYAVYFVILLFIGAILLAFFSQEAQIASFIDQRFSMQAYDQDRFAVQRAAMGAGLNSIIGIGPGQSENTFIGLISHGQSTGATHSLYVRVVAETGFLGMISFFGILFVTAQKSISLCLNGMPLYRKLHCVFASIFFATLINSVVIDSLHWRHFFIVIGIIWGLHLFNEGMLESKTKKNRQVV